MKLQALLQLCTAGVLFVCCADAHKVAVCSSTAVSQPGTVTFWFATYSHGTSVVQSGARGHIKAPTGVTTTAPFANRCDVATPPSSVGLTVSDLADTLAGNCLSETVTGSQGQTLYAYPADSTLTCYDAGSVELYAVGRTGSETPHSCKTQGRDVASIATWYPVVVEEAVSGSYEVWTTNTGDVLDPGLEEDLPDPCSMDDNRHFFLPLSVAAGSALCTTQPDVPAHVVADSLLQCNGEVHEIPVGMQCNAQCEPGYMPVGDLVCEVDPLDSTQADWSTSFSCVAQTCALPDSGNNAAISSMIVGVSLPCTRFTPVGAECEFVCLAPSGLVGVGYIACDGMGAWQPGSNYSGCVAPTPQPPTEVPPTVSPPTLVPDTTAPPTPSPPTTAPETTAPPTAAPDTVSPDTLVPTTVAPETSAPPTPAPLTHDPPTPGPDTTAPTQCTDPDTAPLTCEATASQQCAWRVVQSGRLLAVGFSADGSRVATGSDDGVRVYDSTTGVQVAKLACADFASYDVTFSSDGARVAVGGAGGRVVVCDAVTGELEVTLMDMRAVGSVPVRRVRFTPDARFLVVSGGGSDMRTRVFDVLSGSLEPVIVIHKHAREVAFSADGALLATSWGTEVDEVVTVWRVRNGAKVAELPSRSARVTALSFSASRDELLRGMDDGTVRVSKWAGGVVGEGAVTERLVIETQTKTVFDARHSPNGALLAAVGEGEVTVWRAAGSVAHQLYGHTRAGLPRLAFSPDSTRLATASHDGTLLLWDLL